MAQALAPKTDVAQNTGIMSIAPQASAQPEEAPVQRMYGGGQVKKMQEGRAVYTDPVIIAMASRMGMSIDDYLKSEGPRAARIIAESENRARRDRMVGMEPRLIGPAPTDTIDFTPVNPSYTENLNPVFPNEPIAPESGGLAIEPQPLYGPIPAPLGMGAGPAPAPLMPQRPPVMSPMDRIRAGMEFPLTGEGVRASMPQRERDYAQYVLDNPALSDMSVSRLKAEEIAAGPGLYELGLDIGEYGLDKFSRAGSAVDSKIGDVLAYLGMPELAESMYNVADAEARIPTRIAAAERAREADYAANRKRFSDELARRGAPELQNPAIRNALAAEEAAAAAAAAETAPPGEDTQPPVAETTPPALDTTPPGGGATPPGGGAGAGAGAGAGGAGAAPMSSYEQELASALGRVEKRANQDKWLALAQAGMALMSSKEPTLMGALGEAGIAGLGQYQQTRDAAEKERMGILSAQYQMDMDRQKMALARAGSGGGGGGGYSSGAERLLDRYDAEVAALDGQLDALGYGPGVDLRAIAEANPEAALAIQELINKREQLMAVAGIVKAQVVPGYAAIVGGGGSGGVNLSDE
jgi:hypothetical protein